MLLLSGTADSLELITGGAQSTDWTASYVDITTTTFVPGSGQGNVAAAVTTTIVPAPLSSTTRQIKMLSVRNRDGAASQTVTIQKNHGGTQYRVTGDIVLKAGEYLQYVDGDGFTIFDASGQVKVTATSVGANPSALVHLTATNGVALTFMRSDAAPALDQSIAPTWTGNHTFSPTAGLVAVTVNQASGQLAQFIQGVASAGNSYGLQISAGTNSADYPLFVKNAAATATFLQIFGDGHGTLGPSSALGLSWTTAGNVSAAAPTSGDTLLVTNVAGANALVIAGNSAGTAVIRANTQATTGATTAVFAATNKPGGGTTVATWLPINLDGTTRYIPCWA